MRNGASGGEVARGRLCLSRGLTEARTVGVNRAADTAGLRPRGGRRPSPAGSVTRSSMPVRPGRTFLISEACRVAHGLPAERRPVRARSRPSPGVSPWRDPNCAELHACLYRRAVGSSHRLMSRGRCAVGLRLCSLSGFGVDLYIRCHRPHRISAWRPACRAASLFAPDLRVGV